MDYSQLRITFYSQFIALKIVKFEVPDDADEDMTEAYRIAADNLIVDYYNLIDTTYRMFSRLVLEDNELDDFLTIQLDRIADMITDYRKSSDEDECAVTYTSDRDVLNIKAIHDEIQSEWIRIYELIIERFNW